MTYGNARAAGEQGSFLCELRRLVAYSGRDATEVFSAARVPVTILDGSRSDVERVGWERWKELAHELGVAPADLLRPMLAEFDPWLVPLLDDLLALPPAHSAMATPDAQLAASRVTVCVGQEPWDA